ncbi:hypothetical protein [Cupriavidus taiwanensis]|uniref:hypothetical protein n=1 Tax=Cupriavidus taiwanensis TaxID=164546 RepID=UPI000E179CA6|nr:hypothetical protein [Cupriavidus taiwanensis]SPA44649.1 hypothetical protein CBM2629_A150451 [Cupriavidus taiwanensis]
MIRNILRQFGYRVVYVSEWGEHDSRYDGIDRAMGRPIHKGMSVAPPWARIALRASKEGESNG